MKRRLSGLFLLLIIFLLIVGCSDQQSVGNATYEGTLFTLKYPADQQVWDIYEITNAPESDRDIIPEAIIIGHSKENPLVAIAAYSIGEEGDFNKNDADSKISQLSNLEFYYKGITTIDDATAFVYFENSSKSRAPSYHIVFKKGPHMYYIQGIFLSDTWSVAIDSFRVKEF